MAGWIDNDDMTEKRMNRVWAPTRLLMPVYDVAQGGSVTHAAKPVDGDDVVTTETTHFTFGAGIAVGIVHSITITNGAIGANQVSVHIIASGGSRTASNMVFNDTLANGETIVIEGPWFVAASATIRSISAAATANQVGLRSEVSELTGAPPGVTLAVDPGTTLTTSHASYYACPSSNVQHANAVITLCNTTTTGRALEIAIVPSGQSQSGRYFVFAGTIQPRETIILGSSTQPFVLEASDFISAKAAAASAISIRVSPVEFATT